MRRSLLASAALAFALGCADTAPITSPVPEPEVRTSVSPSLVYVAMDLGGTQALITTVDSYSRAVAINRQGQIVGTVLSAPGEVSAFIWEDGVMTAIGDLRPLDINDAGQVLSDGFVRSPSTSRRAFVWADGVLTDVGTLGGRDSYAWAINEVGQVTGWSRTAYGWIRPFVWNNGVMTDLGTLGGDFASGVALNNLGQVAGWSRTATNETHAFVWEDGVMSDLGTLGGVFSLIVSGGLNRPNTAGFPGAINDAGQIAGTSGTLDGESHPFIWEDGVMTDLGTLGGPQGVSVAINSTGQVIGRSFLHEEESHAFIWENGIMTDLGTLGGAFSDPHAINDFGQVVGTSVTADGEVHAFLWDGGRMIDLGTLGGARSRALSINDAGQIVGVSTTGEGWARPTLWRPLTPIEAIEEPIAAVEVLVGSGDLNEGQGHALINKLNIATAMLNDGKSGPAINQLEAFINQVEAMIPDQIDPVDGQALIDAVQAVIDAL